MYKRHNFDLLTFKKKTFIAIQPNPSYDMLLMSPKEASSSVHDEKREKVTEAFLRLALRPIPLMTTTDKSEFEKLRCHLAQQS